MIDWVQALILAIVQGLTEFLPISSSAHLVLPSQLLGWPDQGLAFDVAVHFGTLLAVMVYYRRDLYRIALDWIRRPLPVESGADGRMVWYIGFATVPAGVVGLAGGQFIEGELRNLLVIATTTLVFGILLGYADRLAARSPGSAALTLPMALMIGMAQGLAPVPGVSRSGITITAALLLGLGRQEAARFSFLLSIPVIASAGALKSWELAGGTDPVDWGLLVLGVLVSGVTAYLCIATFLKLLDRLGLMPFVYYRIALALVLYLVWLT